MTHVKTQTRAARALRIAALLMALSALSPPHDALAQGGAEAVRRVGQLAAEERWEEAIELAREADLDEATRYGLIGVVAMRAGAHKEALVAFERAQESAAQRRERIDLYMAWCHHALGQSERAEEALQRVRSEGAREAIYWLLRGRLLRDRSEASRAYELLRRGRALFPNDLDLAREIGLMLVEFHALAEAREHLILTLTERASAERAWRDGVHLIRALSARDQQDEALLYVEVLRARLPRRGAECDLLAAHLHARAGRPRAAAALFERATLRSGEALYAFEAADQRRVAGQTDAALRWNARLEASPRQRRQRFLILSEGARWARAAIAGAQLARHDEMAEPSLRYRYALALLLGTGDVEGAREHLEAMGDAPQAASLRALIERCEQTPWRCR